MPPLLGCNIDTNLEPKLNWLQQRLSLTDEELSNIIQQMPPLLGCNIETNLEPFFREWSDSINGRTTVIILGDGRNNYNSPRIDLMKQLQLRSKRLLWFNPEHRQQWGTGDSDMLDYAPICDEVFMVRNLAQLSAAVDMLLSSS